MSESSRRNGRFPYELAGVTLLLTAAAYVSHTPLVAVSACFTAVATTARVVVARDDHDDDVPPAVAA